MRPGWVVVNEKAFRIPILLPAVGGVGDSSCQGILPFSAAEALTEGINLLWRQLGLIVPFIIAAALTDLPRSILARFPGEMSPEWRAMAFLPAVVFLSGLASFLFLAWATWLVIERYRSEGIIPRDEYPPKTGVPARLPDFVSMKNPMVPSLIGLGIVFSALSAAQSILSASLGFAGAGVLAVYGVLPVFWVISLILAFAIFGVLLGRRSARGAMGLSRDIVSRTLLQTVGLLIGITIISWVVRWVLSWLVYPLLSVAVGSPGPNSVFFMAAAIAMLPAAGISRAVGASCLCYAFSAAFGGISKVAVAVRHGKALESCPGAPRVPGCEPCRELQDFGDRYYCTRFGKAVKKPR